MSQPVNKGDSEEEEAQLQLEIDTRSMEVYTPITTEDEGIEDMEVQEERTVERAYDTEMVSAAEQDSLNEHVQDIITEEDDPDDHYKPDGTIYLDIDCFSEFCRGPPELQQRLSKPIFVRGLPWKILAIPRESQRSANGRSHRSLGFFLQCNGDSDTVAWNCVASATLKVRSQKEDVEDHSRRISHTFYPKENDWGYSQFLTCDHLANPEHGFIKNDTIKLVVHLSADAPHGVQWDSKKHAGYIGLKNQGATCYMNSILQAFFFTNRLRKAVYEMPTNNDDAENNVALAMQRVFYDLQHSDRPVGTKKLTKSFGWDSIETFMQHDVQELCRVLLDNLESKMKGYEVDGTIPALFRGRMKSYIKCTDVDFESSREEFFYDIQLNIKGKNHILDSFREYIQVERLDGENKYDAGDLGLQPAEKGVRFLSFPPVLHLQLMRFQYDPHIDSNVKINDRFEFPDKLILNEFAEEGSNEDHTYCLHAVLVHSGDFHGGHYVVFINTNLTSPDQKQKPRWCKFDDDVVSRATVRDAIMYNYGGDDSDTPARGFTNAYMLVYIRQSAIANVLCPITDNDIPEHLKVRFENERNEEYRKKKEKMEAHLYTEVMFLTEANMLRHHGYDLIDLRVLEEELPKERVEKGMTVNELYDSVQKKYVKMESMDDDVIYPCFRIWKFEENNYKEDHTSMGTLPRFRPACLLAYGREGADRTLEMALENERNLLYIEGLDGNLQDYDEQQDMLVFIKYYNPKAKEITVVGHIMVRYRRTLRDYVRQCKRMANLKDDASLRFYEEVAPDCVRKIPSLDTPLCNDNLLAEVSDGGILIFENILDCLDGNNCENYLDSIYNKIEVELLMNTDNFSSGNSEPTEPICGHISLKWTCEEISKFIGEKIQFDPEMILLWRMSPFNDRPTQFLSVEQMRTLRAKDILGLVGPQMHDPRRNKRYRLCYSKMPIKVSEMDKRRQMKVQLMDEKMNIQEISIFPERQGTVTNILDECRREFPFAPNGTKKLRLVYVGMSVHALRVYQMFSENTPVMEVFQKAMTPAMYMIRVEEIPADQLVVKNNEYLLPCAHFDRDPSRMFGVPFYFKVSNDEPFLSIRKRLQERLEIPEKELEKYKFALICNGRLIRYLEMDPNSRVNLAELAHAHTSSLAASPFLGIDHMNKSRGSRSSHATEKAIVIHN